MNSSILLVVAAACVLAAYVWGRSAVRLDRAARRITSEAMATGSGLEAARLIRSAFRKSVHTTLLYAILAGGIAVSSISEDYWFDLPLLLLLVPVAISLRSWRSFLAEAPLAEAAPAFGRSVVFLQLEGGDVEQDDAVTRLFDRYKRLAPGRIVTVTATRVKIRQLPGRT